MPTCSLNGLHLIFLTSESKGKKQKNKHISGSTFPNNTYTNSFSSPRSCSYTTLLLTLSVDWPCNVLLEEWGQLESNINQLRFIRQKEHPAPWVPLLCTYSLPYHQMLMRLPLLIYELTLCCLEPGDQAHTHTEGTLQVDNCSNAFSTGKGSSLVLFFFKSLKEELLGEASWLATWKRAGEVDSSEHGVILIAGDIWSKRTQL